MTTNKESGVKRQRFSWLDPSVRITVSMSSSTKRRLSDLKERLVDGIEISLAAVMDAMILKGLEVTELRLKGYRIVAFKDDEIIEL